MARIRPEYVDAVWEAGGAPRLFLPMEGDVLDQVGLDDCAGFVLIGGDDYAPEWFGQTAHEKTVRLHPRRMKWDRGLANWILNKGIPVLGVCGGHQLINLACGGTLIQHLTNGDSHLDWKTHEVAISSGRLLSRVLGEGKVVVNSSHHQAVDAQGVGRGLRVVARATDGIVEALESTDDRFILGVQWHPERMNEGDHRHRIFSALVMAATSDITPRRVC